MTKNVIIKDVLDNSDIELIKAMVVDYKNTLTPLPANMPEHLKGGVGGPTILTNKKELGRLVIHRFKVPESIVKKVSNSLKINGIHNYEYIDATSYLEYSHGNGNPKLPTHIDGDDNELHVDYQIDSSVDWPLIVDDVTYDLVDNSIVTFIGAIQYHSRPVKVFKDGDFVNMLLFRFMKRED
jgi:hypothetical protein